MFPDESWAAHVHSCLHPSVDLSFGPLINKNKTQTLAAGVPLQLLYHRALSPESTPELVKDPKRMKTGSVRVRFEKQ